MANELLSFLGSLQEPFKVQQLNVFGLAISIEQRVNVFGGDVTRGARCVRASTQTSDRSIDSLNPQLQAAIDIGQRHSVCIMKMNGKSIGRSRFEQQH